MARLTGNWLFKSESREKVAEKTQRAHDFLLENGYSLYCENDGKTLESMFGYTLGTSQQLIDFTEIGISSDLALKNKSEYIKKLAEKAQEKNGIKEIVQAMRLPPQLRREFDYAEESMSTMALAFSRFDIGEIRTFVELPDYMSIWYKCPEGIPSSGSYEAGLRLNPSFTGKYYYEGEKQYKQICNNLQESDPFNRLVLSGEVYHGPEFNARGGLNKCMTNCLIETVNTKYSFNNYIKKF